MCWRAVEATVSTSPQAKQVGILKIATGHIAVAHKLCPWNHREDSKCPLCGGEETMNHACQCKHQVAREYWEEGINALEVFLKEEADSTNDTIASKGGVNGLDERG